jgi:ABC-2 type transport system permease protein
MYFFVIGIVLGLHKDFPNYAIHMFSAIVAVHFFTETFSAGTRSIIKNKAIVRKSAMPGEMFPVATVIVSAVNTFPQVLILFIASVATGWQPDVVGILAALLGFAIVTVLGTALALLFSGLNVYFRDFQNVVSTFSMFTHWIVPMIYPFVKLANGLANHPVYYALYVSNPLTVAVVLLQRAFWIPTSLGEPVMNERFPTNANDVGYPYLPHHVMLLGLLMLAVSLVILVLCQLAFRRLEGKFAERL